MDILYCTNKTLDNTIYYTKTTIPFFQNYTFELSHTFMHFFKLNRSDSTSNDYK